MHSIAKKSRETLCEKINYSIQGRTKEHLSCKNIFSNYSKIHRNPTFSESKLFYRQHSCDIWQLLL